jgi:hypothetical protein
VIGRHTNSALSDKTPVEKLEMISSDKKHYGNLRYIDDFIEENEPKASSWSLNNIDERTIQVAKNAYNEVWSF